MIEWSDHKPNNLRLVRKRKNPDPLSLMLGSSAIGWFLGVLFAFLCWLIWLR